MPKLNQVLAIEKGVRSKSDRLITDRYQQVEKEPLLSGISRVYTPKEEDGDQLPSEQTLVQVKVGEVLKANAADFTSLFDVVLTKDAGNQGASADVVIDDQTILSGVPVSTLLFLEKQLTDLYTVCRKLPTLDPADTWSYDPQRSIYVTEPEERVRNKKVPRNHVLAEATDKHPAQVQVYNEDIVAGTWKTIKFSGAMPIDEHKALLDRIAALQNAVKYAREQANSLEVQWQEMGKTVFDFILDA